MRVYAIGDVHGHLDLLRSAHERIAADRARTGDEFAPVVHLGDLCDRGPDSRGVIRFLIDGIAGGAPWRVLRGNHDSIFADFLRDPYQARSWLGSNMGGSETLASYGVAAAGRRPVDEVWQEAVAAIPAAHLEFLDRMDRYAETDDLILVHAGIRPGVALRDQDDEDLIWIRAPFLNDTRDHGRLVVHGHTPVEAPMHCGNRVALDTGAAFGGPLTAAVFEGRAVSIVSEDGRQPLVPPR